MRRLFACLLAAIAFVPLRSIGQSTGDMPADYSFRLGQSRELHVPLRGNAPDYELTWPDSDRQAWDTALLELHVFTANDARVESYVEIEAGAYHDRQYFPPGAQGRHWLNLSHLHDAVAPGARVVLRARSLDFGTDGSAVLRLFAGRPDLSKPVLVLAPHPDDAEIAAFGLYASSHSTVATITAGNAGPQTYEAAFGADDSVGQYRFKGRLRVIDSVTVPWQGDVPPERTANLGYFDTRLATMFETPEQPVPEKYDSNTDIARYRQYNLGHLLKQGTRQATWRNLVADIETLLRKTNPAIIVAPHPLLDAHKDHGFTTVALLEAMANWRGNPALLLYTNHADGNRYPYGPAGTLASLPPAPRQVTIDRVFSLATMPDIQRRKLFALESMHDLRASPNRQYQWAIGEERALQPEGPGPDVAANLSYLRRAPRSNELFFVYDRDSVKPLIEDFLASWRAKKQANPPQAP